MKKSPTYIRSLAIALAFALTALSCNTVHEFPESGKEVDPTIIHSEIHVKVHVGIELGSVITKAAPAIDVKKESADKYDRRFFVEIHNDEFDDSLVQRLVVVRPSQDTSTFSFDADLHARKYAIIVWSDFVAKGDTSDLYFKTGNGQALNKIKVLDRSSYVAGTDYKDSQYFLEHIDLTSLAGVWNYEITLHAPMKTPMAKITFLASDLDKYAENISWRHGLDSLARKMRIAFSYNGYLPTGFNAYTGRLNDSEVGYGFNHNSWYPEQFASQNYTLVGSDYVFVNGEQSSVNVSAIIKDDNGNIINEVSNLNVPIYRGKQTVIIYKFFTKEYVPGIGINPEFDGEFNVYV